MSSDEVKTVKDDFNCDVDLKEYTDSLLFDNDEEIASYSAVDKYGNIANLRLTVAGEKKITRLAKPDTDRDDDDYDYDDDEDFYDVSDYDDELIADIKSGEVYNEDKYEIVYNNWFDIVYELISGEDDDVVYADDEVCETDFS